MLTSSESDTQSYPELTEVPIIDPLNNEVIPPTVGPDVLPITRMQQQEEQQQQIGENNA